jgi:hypothetical protein
VFDLAESVNTEVPVPGLIRKRIRGAKSLCEAGVDETIEIKVDEQEFRGLLIVKYALHARFVVRLLQSFGMGFVAGVEN